MYCIKYFDILFDASLLDEPTLEAGDLLDPVVIVAETGVDVSIYIATVPFLHVSVDTLF